MNPEPSIAFHQMSDPGRMFPWIRVFGTVGWIVAGLMIIALNIEGTQFTFQMAAIASLALGLFSFTLPDTPPKGTIWINSFLRTGFEMFTTGKGADYVAEKAESNSGWLFPVGDELNELGYNHMFADMFNALEKGAQPKETFYDGYVVNSVLDAAYKSAKSKQWEPVKLDIWRGRTGVSKDSHLQEYDKEHYLVKEEMTHYGAKKVILKNKKTGKISEKVLS